MAGDPKKTDLEFAEAVWDLFGIDLEEELEGIASGRAGNIGAQRQIVEEFGMEALGTYCPWHAFGHSFEMPWGIYMHIERLLLEAARLHVSGEFLPKPKPSLLAVLRLLWWLTFRHELFHYHVEMFATRLESSLRSAVYRPYVECVRQKTIHTPECWEEALAQAVVLESKMVKRALGVGSAFMYDNVVRYFDTFPMPYKNFRCPEVGGPDNAHRLFSAQIARKQIVIPPQEWNTGIALAKTEYSTDSTAVPGYLLIRPTFLSRFQLQTPRMSDVEAFVKQHGTIDEKAPGDHKRAKINGQTIQLNRAKRGNTIDLASAKALAR